LEESYPLIPLVQSEDTKCNKLAAPKHPPEDYLLCGDYKCEVLKLWEGYKKAFGA